MPRLAFATALLVLSLSFIPARAADPAPLRVAVYDDAGVSRNLDVLLKVLAGHPDLRVQRLKAADVRDGRLADFDVLVHPGGSGSQQARSLGEAGREQVRAFVRRGGGFVGICAGAYLATRDYDWSLHILDARVVDKKHWARGFGPVDLAPTSRGRDLLGLGDERRSVYYHQGPLLAPGDDPALPDYEELAKFDGEIARNGAPAGVMRGTTAVAASHFGKGRVLCFSPHPERTEGLQDLVHRGIRWSSGR